MMIAIQRLAAVALLGAAAGFIRSLYRDYHSAAWEIYDALGPVAESRCKEWCACQCNMIGCGCAEGPPPRNDPRREHAGSGVQRAVT